jgi:hypothetical protein
MFATPPPPPETPKNPFLQLAAWGLSLVHPEKAAYLTLVVDGCQCVELHNSVALSGDASVPEPLEMLDMESGSMADAKIWPQSPESSSITNEDLEQGLFSLRKGSGALSCRMLVKGMCIEHTAFQLKHSQAVLFDSSCTGLKIKNVTFEGVC